MKKLMFYVVVLFVLISVVNATDCSSQFSNSATKRIRLVADADSLSITTSRLYGSIDDLYSYVDDLHSRENLSSLDSDFDDFVDRKNDVADDIRTFVDDLNSYDSTVSDSRHNMPNACLTTFSTYDKDVSNMKDWYRDVKRYYDRMIPKYDTVANFRNHLSTINASYAKPSISALQDAMSDFDDSVGSGINFNVNATVIANETLYNQSQCFGMIKTNVDLAVRDCNSKCNLFIAKQTQNCSIMSPSTTLVCPLCQSCDSMVNSERVRTRDCEAQLSSLQTQISKPSESMNCSASNGQNSILSQQLQDLRNINSNITAKNLALTKQTESCSTGTCQSCFIYQVAIVVLVFIILFAWIFTM